MFKYLFKALLFDPSQKENDQYSMIEQNENDISPTTPGKNCFYDVIQAENAGLLRAFALYNQETGEEWLVDLNDGHFEHNFPSKNEETGEIVYEGSKFILHDDLSLDNKRLIWFLRRELTVNVVDSSIIKDGISCYNFGFHGNDKSGKNHKFIVTLF